MSSNEESLSQSPQLSRLTKLDGPISVIHRADRSPNSTRRGKDVQGQYLEINPISVEMDLNEERRVTAPASTRRRVRRARSSRMPSFRLWKLKQGNKRTGTVKRGKDALPPNDKAFRITPQDGIEMHILSKRWDIRALTAYDLSQIHWKSVELSFIPHHLTPKSPSRETEKEESEGRRIGTEKSTSAAARDAPLGHVTPVFDGSVYYGPLHLSFTGAALEALWGCIKFLDLWFAFIRGVSRNIRQDPVPALVDPYFKLWKQKISGIKLQDEELEKIFELEYQLPLYALLETREKAEIAVYGSMGLVGLARHIRGTMTSTLKNLGNMFGKRTNVGCCESGITKETDEFHVERGTDERGKPIFSWRSRICICCFDSSFLLLFLISQLMISIGLGETVIWKLLFLMSDSKSFLMFALGVIFRALLCNRCLHMDTVQYSPLRQCQFTRQSKVEMESTRAFGDVENKERTPTATADKEPSQGNEITVPL